MAPTHLERERLTPLPDQGEVARASRARVRVACVPSLRTGVAIFCYAPSQAMAVRSVMKGRVMKARMTLGDFLVAYLRKIGVTRVFGIPGDLALRLFFALGRKHRPRDRHLLSRTGRGLRRRRLRPCDRQDRRDLRDLRRRRAQYGQPGRGFVLRARAAPDLLGRSRRGRTQARHADPSSGPRDRIAASHLPGSHLRVARAHRSAARGGRSARRDARGMGRAASRLRRDSSRHGRSRNRSARRNHRMGRPSPLPRVRCAQGRGSRARHRRDVQRGIEARRDRGNRNPSLQGLARSGRTGRKDGRAGADHRARQRRLSDGPSAVHGRTRRADQPRADRQADGRGRFRAQSRLPQDRHELRQPPAAYYSEQDRMGRRSARGREVPQLYRCRRARLRARADAHRSCGPIASACNMPTTCARPLHATEPR